MSVDIAPDQVDLILDIHEQLEGGCAFITGRAQDVVDSMILDMPGSYEMHAAWRKEKGGHVQPLTVTLKSDELEKQAYKKLNTIVPLFDTSAPITDPANKEAGVFLQSKKHSFAMVHVGLDALTVQDLKEIAAELLDELDLSETHKIMSSTTSVEIAPRIAGKEKAIAQFMNTYAFAGAIPVVIGDSMTDYDAMKEAHKYDGFGIAVGKAIPNDDVVRLRVATPGHVWSALRTLSRDFF